MRIGLRTGPAALTGAVFVAALIVMLPMRLALDWLGAERTALAARTVSGTVWSGTLGGARVGAIELGDVHASLSPFALLLGQARIALSSGAADGRQLRGTIAISRHSQGADNVTGAVSIGQALAPLPVERIELEDVSVQFRDGGCARADGRVRATLGADLAGIGITPQLSGALRCDGTALLVPLASQAGAEAVTLRVSGDGRYQAEVAVQPPDAASAARLSAIGFQPGPRGQTFSITGRF